MSAMKSPVPRSRVLRGISPTDNSLSPSPSPQRQISSRRLKSENVPPPDPNAFHEPPSKPPLPKARSPLPPRPPSSNSNPLKRKLSMETVPENGSVLSSDSGVQVIVRMRPKKEEEGDQIVQKISANSVSILDHVFTFDSVGDVDSTQQDMFELVGVPLVENCLDGFNSSIFAYGQTGSGKTYTMWGPPNSLTEDDLSIANQKGLTPRVFELLFSRINEEKIKHTDKELNYQCRCSFLEIYNEQITDLLDPSRKNLQIREDVKSGVYVEALTEEYVCDMKDLMKVLVKGLANRRTGATSINAESSRSHSVFTCVLESRCKKTTGGLSSLRTSRINLVDLAGSERQKLTGAAGERLKEAGNINRSLSQLGNLINILAEVSQSGKQRHIPYRDSRLTFLLQESLGGNAKLAMICAISPAQSCKSETFSTLRFAQRAKAIKNKAVVNEEKQEDMNSLREVIRQLRDELLWLKSNGHSANNNGGYTTGWNARRSLNLLKRSLNHLPMTLHQMDEDGDEVMEIDEEAVERLCVQVGLELPISHVSQAVNQVPEEADVNMEDCQEEDTPSDQLDKHALETNLGEVNGSSEATCPENDAQDNEGCSDGCETRSTNSSTCTKSENGGHLINNNVENLVLANGPMADEESPSLSVCSPSPNVSSLSIVPYDLSFQSPTLSTSPRINSLSRKSLRTSSTLSGSKKDVVNEDVLSLSFARTSKNSPTEYLEASLHRGLQIIDSCQQSGALRRSSFRFSVKPVDLKSVYLEKVDAGVQTLSEDLELVQEDQSTAYICSYCKNKTTQLDECQVAADVNDLPLVPVDDCQVLEKSKMHVPKAVEKVLTGAIRREMAIEEVCAKQTAEISQLNRLIQQYKHERECNAIIEQTREDKIRRLEGLMDGVLPTEEFMQEEFLSLTNEHKLLKEKYEYHPEVLRMKIELKRVQDELDSYKNYFEMGERDVLMEEIQNLRSQLHYYVDSSPLSGRAQRSSLLQLTYPSGPVSSPVLSTIQETPEENLEEKFEQERRNWTEIESNWISLSEELRSELEASRSLVEKQKHELDAERKCSEELKEALQLAMQGHANILDQYAELQEKHIALLARHRKIRDGIADVKKAATKAGVKGAESKFIDSLAAEISALKVEREKEWRYLRDENKGLQAQLRDTAEAVQAAGELLVRLKEAEEAVSAAQKRVVTAEEEAAKAHKEINKLKKKHETEIATLNQFLAESRLPKEALRPPPAFATEDVAAKFDDGDCPSDQRWREEFEPFCQAGGSSWFAGYDQCNM
ncbi:hypothetical protein H6P81_014054 [Aristolochia fimbriata]|uniref:Kinesin motor domain-containing protein n=1 Tax=Aristolochia fimbriata TaxID=158543 RepID=A0AAV7EJ90_ARIFI|nr:hypothetical protein H6P81_014054 [Aristolochia fimbriata]